MLFWTTSKQQIYCTPIKKTAAKCTTN